MPSFLTVVENKNLDVTMMPSAIAINTMRRGIAHDKIGKKAEGFEIFEKGVSQYRQFLELNKEDVSSLLYAGDFLLIAVDFYVSQNQKRKAANVWQDYAERFEPFLKNSPNDAGLQKFVARGFELAADVLSGFKAGDNSFSETDKSLLTEALENYEKSLSEIRQISKNGEPAGEITKTIESLERKISVLKSKLF